MKESEGPCKAIKTAVGDWPELFGFRVVETLFDGSPHRQNDEEAADKLNARLFEWLSSHGWAGPTEVAALTDDMVRAVEARTAAEKERDEWKGLWAKAQDSCAEHAKAEDEWKADAERLAGALKKTDIEVGGLKINVSGMGLIELRAFCGYKEALAAHDSLQGEKPK